MEKKRAGHEIKTISNLIKREISGMFSEEEHITGVQGRILGYLYHHQEEEIFQRDLEAEFLIRRSTVTGILQLMEKNGYIRRISAPDDARMKKLIITEKGIEAQRRMKDRLCRFEDLFQSNITPEDLQYLKKLFKQLEENIK